MGWAVRLDAAWAPEHVERGDASGDTTCGGGDQGCRAVALTDSLRSFGTREASWATQSTYGTILFGSQWDISQWSGFLSDASRGHYLGQVDRALLYAIRAFGIPIPRGPGARRLGRAY